MSSCELSGPCPWRRLRHLSPAGSQQLQGLLASLGAAECAELLLDRFLELFHERRSCDLIYIINYLGSGQKLDIALVCRVYLIDIRGCIRMSLECLYGSSHYSDYKLHDTF